MGLPIASTACWISRELDDLVRLWWSRGPVGSDMVLLNESRPLLLSDLTLPASSPPLARSLRRLMVDDLSGALDEDEAPIDLPTTLGVWRLCAPPVRPFLPPKLLHSHWPLTQAGPCVESAYEWYDPLDRIEEEDL